MSRNDKAGRKRKRIICNRRLAIERLSNRLLLAADLDIQQVSTDGEKLLVSFDVLNDDAAAFYVGIYSSSDGNNLDTLIQSIPVSSNNLLAEGVGRVVSVDVDFDDSLNDYYLIAVLDINDDVSESDESNNAALLDEGVFVNNYDDSLHIQGSTGGDSVSVSAGSTTDIYLNAAYYGYSSTFSLIHVVSHDGDDSITGSTSITSIRAFGGPGDDTAYGGSASDEIYGGSGNDYLNGGSGDDVAYGGSGSDSLFGGAGGDYLEGGLGGDYLDGGMGADYIAGGDGNDTIDGQGGVDYLYGGSGNDVVYGGDDGDYIYGDDGNDSLNGDDGQDSIYGGSGNDTISGGLYDDHLSGESGNDYIYGDYGNDTAYGGPGLDSVFGGDGDDFLSGGDDDDYVSGDSGDDSILGDDGADSLLGADGADYISGGDGDDWLSGGNDADSIYGDDGRDYLFGDDGDDWAYGGAGDDFVSGGGGDDYLLGDAGMDVVYGDDGQDSIDGGIGNDYLIGDDTIDTIADSYGNNEIMEESEEAYGGAIPVVTSFYYSNLTESFVATVEDADEDPTGSDFVIGGGVSLSGVVFANDNIDAGSLNPPSGWYYVFVTDSSGNVSPRVWHYFQQ